MGETATQTRAASPTTAPAVVHVQPAPLVVREVAAYLNKASVTSSWSKFRLPVPGRCLPACVLYHTPSEALFRQWPNEFGWEARLRRTSSV
eukprot:CAMPEP_0171062946 /NCGR_PEP_ID=MMETSP0766_2-20121228/5346_1 /TAXON_ID=439317 /ORGANISM="Gambierdiscus australes, Strain CAWD 149" /LENGTH=90 /DNA_ID=CAMNT_0011518783 /DNA_START=77 /DNA_END=349 /DNA_ORIENTATION=+